MPTAPGAACIRRRGNRGRHRPSWRPTSTGGCAPSRWPLDLRWRRPVRRRRLARRAADPVRRDRLLRGARRHGRLTRAPPGPPAARWLAVRSRRWCRAIGSSMPTARSAAGAPITWVKRWLLDHERGASIGPDGRPGGRPTPRDSRCPRRSRSPGFSFAVGGKAFAWVVARTDRAEEGARPEPGRHRRSGSRTSSRSRRSSSLDPDVFFTEPHYNGYPAVLVRLPAIDVGLLEKVLTDAWRSRAPKTVRLELAPRASTWPLDTSATCTTRDQGERIDQQACPARRRLVSPMPLVTVRGVSRVGAIAPVALVDAKARRRYFFALPLASAAAASLAVGTVPPAAWVRLISDSVEPANTSSIRP